LAKPPPSKPSFAYVTNFGDSSVSVIDAATLTVTATIEVAGPTIELEHHGILGPPIELKGHPFGIALSPDKQLLFVTLYDYGVVQWWRGPDFSNPTQFGLIPLAIPDFENLYASTRGVVVTPDGSRAYVVSRNGILNPGGAGGVGGGYFGFAWLIDTTTLAATQLNAGAPFGGGEFVGFSNPYCMAAYKGPAGTRIYITDAGTGGASPFLGGLFVVDDNNPNAGPTLPLIAEEAWNPNLFFFSSGVAVNSDGFVYVGNNGAFFYWAGGPGDNAGLTTEGPGSVTAGKEFLRLPPITGIGMGVIQATAGIAASPDGSRIYVADAGNNYVAVIDGTSDGTTKKVILATSAPVLSRPMGVAVTPDGSSLYVANSGANTVAVMDAQDLKLVRTITVGNNPMFIAM
jgi:YVTN family beta-propeller protein